ncbi:hypothetical protein [Secundilactobacillus kimchicus]|uniref:hypothetical protein n=1 Tax=Secundilactobacillus kimchicus TaxID=528209 RepID=UPI0006D11228|nr:hypothetical protein [Secundilactobacillus kimchicus]
MIKKTLGWLALGAALGFGGLAANQTASAATWHAGTPSLIRHQTMQFKEDGGVDTITATANTITYKTPYRRLYSTHAKFAVSGQTTVVKCKSGGYTRYFKFKKSWHHYVQFSIWRVVPQWSGLL